MGEKRTRTLNYTRSCSSSKRPSGASRLVFSVCLGLLEEVVPSSSNGGAGRCSSLRDGVSK